MPANETYAPHPTHPLHDVPQEILDAARTAAKGMGFYEGWDDDLAFSIADVFVMSLKAHLNYKRPTDVVYYYTWVNQGEWRQTTSETEALHRALDYASQFGIRRDQISKVTIETLPCTQNHVNLCDHLRVTMSRKDVPLDEIPMDGPDD